MKGVFFLQKKKTPLLEEYKSESAIFFFKVRELLPPPDWNPIHSVRMWKKNLFSKLSKAMIFSLQRFTLCTYSCLFLWGTSTEHTPPAEYLIEVPALCWKIP